MNDLNKIFSGWGKEQEADMKRTWLVWTLVGGVLVTVLIAFNYERGKEAVPLSEIFPGKGALHNEVEYEFLIRTRRDPLWSRRLRQNSQAVLLKRRQRLRPKRR